MKKIFTLLLAFTSLSLFAQRSCDVQVVLTSPKTGDKIHSGYPFNLNYSVKNLGPDKLMVGDTISWFLSLDGVKLGGTWFYRLLTAEVAKDAIIQSTNVNLQFNVPTENPAANFCAEAYVRKVTGQVSDPTPANDKGCAVINLRSTDIKVIGKGLAVATDVNASPNPAKDVVNISYTLVNPETVTVSLFDMNGRLVVDSVSDKQGAGENSLQLNTSELNAGLYFYEVKIGNQSEKYKLMVK